MAGHEISDWVEWHLNQQVISKVVAIQNVIAIKTL